MKPSVLLFFVALCHGGPIPSSFKKCSRKDPNFKQCCIEAAQHAVSIANKPFKSLDLPSLEPLKVTELTVKGKGGSVALDQHFKNCDVKGLTSMKFNRFEIDLEKDKFLQVATVPNFVLACEYKVDGKVLLLPVQGEGNSVVTLKNLRIDYSADFEKSVKGGKTYYSIADSKAQIEPEHASYHFDNLFNGNKELGDNINNVINDNWKEIFDEVKDDYVELLRQIITTTVGRVLKKASLEEVFD